MTRVYILSRNEAYGEDCSVLGVYSSFDGAVRAFESHLRVCAHNDTVDDLDLTQHLTPSYGRIEELKLDSAVAPATQEWVYAVKPDSAKPEAGFVAGTWRQKKDSYTYQRVDLSAYTTGVQVLHQGSIHHGVIVDQLGSTFLVQLDSRNDERGGKWWFHKDEVKEEP